MSINVAVETQDEKKKRKKKVKKNKQTVDFEIREVNEGKRKISFDVSGGTEREVCDSTDLKRAKIQSNYDDNNIKVNDNANIDLYNVQLEDIEKQPSVTSNRMDLPLMSTSSSTSTTTLASTSVLVDKPIISLTADAPSQAAASSSSSSSSFSSAVAAVLGREKELGSTETLKATREVTPVIFPSLDPLPSATYDKKNLPSSSPSADLHAPIIDALWRRLLKSQESGRKHLKRDR